MQVDSNVGTPIYMSPELCNGLPYDAKADMWAFGCLIYELVMFKPPFRATNLVDLANKICKSKPDKAIPTRYSKGLRHLISALLRKDPAKRCNVDKVVKFALKMQSVYNYGKWD